MRNGKLRSSWWSAKNDEAPAFGPDIVVGLQIFENPADHLARCTDAGANFLLGQPLLDNQASTHVARERLQQFGDAAMDVDQREIAEPLVHLSRPVDQALDQSQRGIRMVRQKVAEHVPRK